MEGPLLEGRPFFMESLPETKEAAPMTKRKSFLIAMSGGSGSGKSTLAVALLERLGPGKAVMFGEDAYYNPMAHYGAPGHRRGAPCPRGRHQL